MPSELISKKYRYTDGDFTDMNFVESYLKQRVYKQPPSPFIAFKRCYDHLNAAGKLPSQGHYENLQFTQFYKPELGRYIDSEFPELTKISEAFKTYRWLYKANRITTESYVDTFEIRLSEKDREKLKKALSPVLDGYKVSDVPKLIEAYGLYGVCRLTELAHEVKFNRFNKTIRNDDIRKYAEGIYTAIKQKFSVDQINVMLSDYDRLVQKLENAPLKSQAFGKDFRATASTVFPDKIARRLRNDLLSLKTLNKKIMNYRP